MSKIRDFLNSPKTNRVLEAIDDFVAGVCILMLFILCDYVHDPFGFAGFTGDQVIFFSFVLGVFVEGFGALSYWFFCKFRR